MNAALIPVLGILIGVLVQLHIFEIKRRDGRINDFITPFFSKYRGAGRALEPLIPSGINNLKNDKEIKTALRQLENRLGFHPLRRWNADIEKIGYKKFFKVVVTGLHGTLNANNIDKYIEEAKKE